jgi:hypothetical protein
MKDNRIKNKVRVFISSSCESKYKIVRRSLKTLLEETNMCNVFIFEDEDGSTQDVVSTYMIPLEKSELCIIIIDNNDKITDATLKEINRARELKKKCLFVFCDEYSKEWTKLQEELTKNLRERYIVVHEFSKITEEVYESVLRDITNIYQLYCSGKINSENVENKNTIEELVIVSESNNKNAFDKHIVKGYELTKCILNENICFSIEKPKSINNLDRICATILEVVLGNKDVNEIDFISLKNELDLIHSNSISNVIKKRIDAMECYWKGNIQEGIVILDNCLDDILSSSNIPNWLKNDIAIDSRNMHIIEDNNKNIFNYKTKAQEFLDSNEEPVYFPLLDRYNSDFNEKVAKANVNDKLESPYTVSFGGLEAVTEKLCNTFILGLLYGSITHSVLSFRTKLLLYLEGLCIQYREHKMYICLVKQMLLLQEHNRLKKFLRSYGEFTDNINNIDINALKEAIDRINIPYKKLTSGIMLFYNFGYYFSDEQYDAFCEELFINVDIWLDEQNAILTIGTNLLNSLIENVHRLNPQRILSICYKIFQKKYRRWYDDVFKVVSTIPIDKLDKDGQRECVNWIISCIEDNEIIKQCNQIGNAVQNIRRLSKVKLKTIDNKVKKYMPDFYEDTYSLNILEYDKETGWKYLVKYIEHIDDLNINQGKDGRYTGYTINPYRTIKNIIINSNIRFSAKQLDIVIKTLQGTLFAEKQLCNAKADALELLSILAIKYSKSSKVLAVFELINKNTDKILLCHNDLLLNAYNTRSISFNYELLKIVLSKAEHFDIVELFSDMQQEEDSVKISSLVTLRNILEQADIKKIEENILNTIVQYILNLSKVPEREVRFHASITMVLLLNTGYRNLILKRISMMMNGETFENKVALLSRLGKRGDKDEMIEFILQKGSVDNHYWVRKIAERYI